MCGPVIINPFASAMAASSAEMDKLWTVVEPNATVKASIKTDIASAIQEIFPSFDHTQDEAHVYKYTHIATYYRFPPDDSEVLATSDHFPTPGSCKHFRQVAYMLLHAKPAGVEHPGTFDRGIPQGNTVVFVHKGSRGELGRHYSSGLHGDSKFYSDQGVTHPQLVHFNWKGSAGPKRRVEFILVDPNTYIGVNPSMGYRAWFYAKRCTGSELDRSFWQKMASKPLLPCALAERLGEMD